MGLLKLDAAELDALVEEVRAACGGELSDQERRERLERLGGKLRKLTQAAALAAALEKTAWAGNADRAEKLLRAHGGATRASRSLALGGAGAVAALVFGGGGGLFASCAEGSDEALAALNRCSAPARALGGPVGLATVGCTTGTSKTGSGGGSSRWSVRVAGSKGSGWLNFSARSDGGPWRIRSAEVSTPEGKFSVVPCGAAVQRDDGVSADGVFVPLSVALTFQGKVVETEGAAPVSLGAACTADVTPADTRSVERGYNCSVRVRCGAATIYGWEGTGSTRCPVEGGRPLGAHDLQGASEGDDPKLELDLEGRQLEVSDDPEGGSFRVRIELAR